MKKFICAMLLAAGLSAGLAAQSKMAAGLDLMPLFKGVIWSDTDEELSLIALSPSFEYRIAPHYSIGGTADLWFGKVSTLSIFYLGINAQGRWYPLSEGLDKLFLGAALGYERCTVEDVAKPIFSGFTAGLQAGWRLLVTPNFFVEPSMAFVIAETKPDDFFTTEEWQPGLKIGMTF
jgi:hypothetical protein